MGNGGRFCMGGMERQSQEKRPGAGRLRMSPPDVGRLKE